MGVAMRSGHEETFAPVSY
jgi:hypothetical protein